MEVGSGTSEILAACVLYVDIDPGVAPVVGVAWLEPVCIDGETSRMVSV